MPVYEYVCQPCQRRFERFVQRFGDQVECPHCQNRDVERQLSTFAFSSGWACFSNSEPVVLMMLYSINAIQKQNPAAFG